MNESATDRIMASSGVLSLLSLPLASALSLKRRSVIGLFDMCNGWQRGDLTAKTHAPGNLTFGSCPSFRNTAAASNICGVQNRRYI
ncbi:hypothetical protein B0J12DRAFT_638792, partial [Macrophomina phaseolina]